MLSTILIIILILLLVGALPTWPYSSGWGYYPGGTLGLILIIVIILALIGRIEQVRLQSSLGFPLSFKRNRWPKHRMTGKSSGHRGFFSARRRRPLAGVLAWPGRRTRAAQE